MDNHGRPIPVEKLLTEDDFAIIREESYDAADDTLPSLPIVEEEK